MRAAPGAQLSQGRLRVDAARAIAKLREYQLVDKTMWILEAIRAAVASGATHLRIRGDANDVWLTWQGPAWEPDTLRLLFDELVSPEPAEAHQHFRLLATALNTALGLEPAHVDIVAIPPEGPLAFVRYKPEVLVVAESSSGDLDDSPLRKLRVEQRARDSVPGAFATGMAVHFRRPFGLDVVLRFARLEGIAELRHAAMACRWIGVPLEFEDVTVSRDTRGDEVIRVPLGPPFGPDPKRPADGYLAVVDPAKRVDGARSELVAAAERGVVLATYPIDLGLLPDLSARPSTHRTGERPIPIRILIDAPRLPVNASRSEVRRDAAPIPLVETRVKELVPQALIALRDLLREQPQHRAAREAVFALMAAQCPDHASLDNYASALAPLHELELLRDACGTPRRLDHEWGGFVHTGGSAFPLELAPWLGNVLWAPDDDPARRLVSRSIDRRSLRGHVRWARRQLRAQEAFERHAQRPLRVDSETPPRVRAQLGVPLPGSTITSSFADVRGEICVFETAGRGHGEVTVLLRGRELDRLDLSSQLAFVAIVEDPRVQPADRYRGARRDNALLDLENLIRDAAVRAVEALAMQLVGETPPAGYEVAPLDRERDVPIIQRAIASLSELGGTLLSRAPIWETRDGKWLSLDELAQLNVVAVAGPGTYVPPGRVVLAGSERLLLAKLLPNTQFVSYEISLFARSAGPGAATETIRFESTDLATLLVSESEHVLAVDDEPLRGAIGIRAATVPVDTTDSKLFHAGIELARWSYASKLVPAIVYVESDAAIPDDNWTGANHDAGVPRADYKEWEIALCRAVARALVDDRDPRLFGGPLGIESAASRALFAAFASMGPATLLGPELAAKLRAAPLLQLLGDPQPRAIDELAELFPWGITYVAEGRTPEPGFTPLVASEAIATALGALVGRAPIDGEPELERRAKERLHADRLAKHRERPTVEVKLPYDTTSVQIHSIDGKGVMGVSNGGMEIHVLVEQRPFEVIRRPDELPVIAVIEVPAARTSDTFEGLAPASVESIVSTVRASASALIDRIGATNPAAFGDPGREQTLLATWISNSPGVGSAFERMRDRLRAMPAWRTVQSQDGTARASIKQATRVDLLMIGTWHEDWLPAKQDRHPIIDGDVLAVEPPAADQRFDPLRAILSGIHPGLTQDVTDEIAKVQAQRQMASGIIPVPKLPHASAFVRTFRQLGETDTDLGFGEIALVDNNVSVVYIHARGVMRERVEVDIVPPVEIAIEGPELVPEPNAPPGKPHPIARLSSKLWRVTGKLVGELARGQLLTPPLLAHVRRAVLSGRLDASTIGDAPLFATVDGPCTWATIDEQRKLFGNVWAVPEATQERPLDERRRVLVLAAREIAAAQSHLGIIDARRDLQLDAIARRNRSRPRATSLAIGQSPGSPLPGSPSVLAIAALAGDGTTGPRGHVAVLAPDAAHLRMAYPHREMIPLDPVADPCHWPTFAILDDARIVPDRMWQAPEGGPLWHDVLTHIRAASDRALALATPIPGGVLAAERMTNLSHDGLPSLKTNPKVRIRGALWISGAPHGKQPVAPIRVAASDGTRAFPSERDNGLTGTLFVYAPDGFHDVTIRELCAAVYSRLVRSMSTKRDLDADLVQAHAIHALALERLQAVDVRNLKLECFAPEPLDAAGWVALLAARKRLPVIAPRDAKSKRSEPAIIDDGTELSRLAQSWIEVKATSFAPRLDDAPSSKPESIYTTTPKPEPPRPKTPVEQLAARVVDLLVGLDVPRPGFVVSTGATPMLEVTNHQLVFAGAHLTLAAIAAAMLANTMHANAAISALAAHALSLLNRALESVTDPTEIRAVERLLAGA